jgi:hypothetical protein
MTQETKPKDVTADNGVQEVQELQQLLQEIPKELLIEALREELNPSPQEQVSALIASEIHQHYSGPIPPPKMLS